jgi:hypothetical protein
VNKTTYNTRSLTVKLQSTFYKVDANCSLNCSLFGQCIHLPYRVPYSIVNMIFLSLWTYASTFVLPTHPSGAPNPITAKCLTPPSPTVPTANSPPPTDRLRRKTEKQPTSIIKCETARDPRAQGCI